VNFEKLLDRTYNLQGRISTVLYDQEQEPLMDLIPTTLLLRGSLLSLHLSSSELLTFSWSPNLPVLIEAGSFTNRLRHPSRATLVSFPRKYLLPAEVTELRT
jgi:hypothetical protein